MILIYILFMTPSDVTVFMFLILRHDDVSQCY